MILVFPWIKREIAPHRGRIRTHGAQLVGEIVRYEDAYKLCYFRGPEGLLIGLAEELG
jgi:hypothetical protein